MCKKRFNTAASRLLCRVDFSIYSVGKWTSETRVALLSKFDSKKCLIMLDNRYRVVCQCVHKISLDKHPSSDDVLEDQRSYSEFQKQCSLIL